MILIYVLYCIIIIIRDSILLAGLKLGNEVLDVSWAGAKFTGFRSEGDLILDDTFEWWVQRVPWYV